MLNQETKDSLSKLGFDVSKLEEAIKAESEQSLEVPKLFTEEDTKGMLTEEQKSTFGKNRFEEGKKAVSEILAKQYKDKFSLDIEGKDIDTVVQAVHDKGLASGNDKDLSGRFKNLQEKYTILEKDFGEYKSNTESQRAMDSQRFKLLGALSGKETTMAHDDLVDFYLMKNKLEVQNGSVVVLRDGQVVKDNLESPVEPSVDLLAWVDKKDLMKKSGMGQGDKGSGGSSGTFSDVDEAYNYLVDNNIDPMSPEGIKIVQELKT